MIGASHITVVSQVAKGPWMFRYNSEFWPTMKWALPRSKILFNFSAERNSLGSDRIFVYRYNRLYPVFKMLYENRDSQEQVSGCKFLYFWKKTVVLSTCVDNMKMY